MIVAQILALSPSSVDQAIPLTDLTQEELITSAKQGAREALGIPTRVADYTVDQFHYTSTKAGLKQWKLIAARAFFFNHERIVHALEVKAELYEPDGKITHLEGLEAKYYLGEKNLEVFGDVKTRFPDGFETISEYMRYLPNERHIMTPTQYFVKGGGQQEKGRRIDFESMGLDYLMGNAEIILPKQVKVTMTTPGQKRSSDEEESEGDDAQAPSQLPAHLAQATPAAAASPVPPDKTVIESDRCAIDRAKQIAKFTMDADRKIEDRFVRINQTDMFTRSRWAELDYSDRGAKAPKAKAGGERKSISYMTAYEDVLLKEKRKDRLRYGTGGRADFDAHQNIVILRDFPQVYQDNDTVTGDIIILHRDTDVVEVDHSNAYSEGMADP